LNDLVSAVILAAFEDSSLSKLEQSFFHRYPVAGVTLFRRNIDKEQGQIKNTLTQLQSLAPITLPMIVSIDQEGGRVSRMPSGFPDLGPPFFIGRSNPTSQQTLSEIKTYGTRVANLLRDVGVNVNFAPVCDLNTNLANTAIGDRCWSRDPDAAARRAGAFIDGMREGGVHSCLKHFPGQGDADADTHLSGAAIHVSRSTMQQRELRPFMDLFPKSPMVMISHCIFSDYDSKPASLSSVIQQQLLKKQCGFDGLIVSDDMNMKAISQNLNEWVGQIEEAIMAGSDLILICRDVQRITQAIDALAKRASESLGFRQRLIAAKASVDAFRKKLSIEKIS
jgi:beta-N-acetylhexosaminidase